MQKKGWNTDAFYFKYRRRYYVFVEIFDKEVSSKYTNKDYFNYILFKITFRVVGDFDNKFSTVINTTGFLDDRVKEEFINYFAKDNGNEFNFEWFLGGFYNAFRECIPPEVQEKEEDLKNALCKELDYKSGNQNKGRYCYDLRDLPIGRHRTKHNNDKAKLFAPPNLYEQFKNNNRCSFYFSPESEAECTTEEIVAKYIKRKH